MPMLNTQIVSDSKTSLDVSLTPNFEKQQKSTLLKSIQGCVNLES